MIRVGRNTGYAFVATALLFGLAEYDARARANTQALEPLLSTAIQSIQGKDLPNAYSSRAAPAADKSPLEAVVDTAKIGDKLAERYPFTSGKEKPPYPLLSQKSVTMDDNAKQYAFQFGDTTHTRDGLAPVKYTVIYESCPGEKSLLVAVFDEDKARAYLSPTRSGKIEVIERFEPGDEVEVRTTRCPQGTRLYLSLRQTS